MKTPILDFLKKYSAENTVRLHMPGHKGVDYLGVENLDLTEINGADSLYDANGIIAESEKNASDIFGVKTYYSTEGSSLAIRAMLYLCLQYAKANGKSPFILAGRNAHKTFVSAVGLLDFKVKWLYPQKQSYLSCNVSAKQIDGILNKIKQKPVAIYLTSPDYLGNVVDIAEISKVCKKHGVLLLVDCAHGSYLRFLDDSKFPTDLGADMCCSSAHKTLPVLTGGAYLHVGESILNELNCNPKTALSLFGSTSPSYLIMASLDGANKVIKNGYREDLSAIITRVNALKKLLKSKGYEIVGNELLKITLKTKSYGYKGEDFSKLLENKGVFCEFCDEDFVVMMFTSNTPCQDFDKIESVLLSIEKSLPIKENPPKAICLKRKTSIRKAMLSPSEYLPIDECKGRVLACLNVSCPPAVQIVCAGEIIDERAIEIFKYYKIQGCNVIKK